MKTEKLERSKQEIIKELEKTGFTNYYLQMFNQEIDLAVRIELLLKLIGVKPGLLGFEYTKEAVAMIYEEDKTISPTKLYAAIYEKYNATSVIAVERGIRHSKELLFKKDDKLEIKKLVFGNVLYCDNTTYLYSLKYFLKSFKI